MTNTADESATGDSGSEKNGQGTETSTSEVKEKTKTAKAEPAKTVKTAEQVKSEPYTPVKVDIKSLMAAGAHFGHQTPRWNPKMTKYIYGERNGIHILNLDITLEHWQKAVKFVRDVVARGGEVLLVGTKPQAQRAVREAAQRSGAHYVVQRWLGGTLSNFQTIKNSIQRMKKLEELLRKAEDPNSDINIAKKERVKIRKDLDKLEAALGGIKDMKKIPDVVFVVDIIKESIAVAECRKLHVPIVGLVDTNTNPAPIDFPIPSNDDAARAISLFTNAIADAVIAGKLEHKTKKAKDAKAAASKSKAAKEKAKGKKEATIEAAAPAAQ